MRAGIAGSGFAAEFHVAGLKGCAGLGVAPAAVYSPDASRRVAFAARHGLAAAASLEELLGQVDAVHVCAPPATHEEIVCAALAAGVHVIVEKPFTGCFAAADTPRAQMEAAAVASARRMLAAEQASSATIGYAENWVFAPAVQKEAEIVRKSRAQILRMAGEESHSGSHSPLYGIWRHSGGGSLVGKVCHPLTAILFLKEEEGRANGGAPIRPATVSARVHALTRLPGYRDAGHLRADYEETEDCGSLHVTFADGTVADVFASEIVLGGVYNWLEVFANNHRTRCNLNPIDALHTYNPAESQLDDVYVVEKIGTKQGWSQPAPDEDWMHGYPQELAHFYQCFAAGSAPQCGAELGFVTTAVLYAAYRSAEQNGEEVPVAELPAAP